MKRETVERNGVTHWRCSSCKELFPPDGFHKNRRSPLGITSACRKCHNATALRTRDPENTRRLRRESSRKMRELNPDKYAEIDLKRTFGITLADYQTMLDEQKGVCAICKQTEQAKTRKGAEKSRRLAVDHDHQTGKIRGLLCYRCNTVLGNVGDNADILEAASEYVRLHQK